MKHEDAKDENKDNSALYSENWPFDLDLLPLSAFMVGGAVRDALLGRRREYLDLDFVLPNGAVETASAIANHYKAGFVLLDRDREIARVVFKNATADFARQEGNSLEKDLHRRDYTINAIAYNPRTQEIIDPLQGYADLQAGVIRMVSSANLADDPLRLLRGYRQAAQLGFAIEPQTRSTMRQLAPLLGNMAAERVRVELNYLLNSPQGTPWLSAAWEDGILEWVLHDNLTAANLALLAEIDRAYVRLAEKWPQLAEYLLSNIPGLAEGAKRTWIAIAKLACLLIPQGPPNPPNLGGTNFSDSPNLGGNQLFSATTPNVGGHGGEISDVLEQKVSGNDRLEIRLNYTRAGISVQNSTIEDFLKQITYSLPEIRAINTIIKFLPQMRSPSMSLRSQYFFFREVGVVFPALAVVAVATGTKVEDLAYLSDHYLNPNDQVAHPTPLVTGNDLIASLNLKPSPKIGQLLIEIQIARIEGKISTPTEAINFASQLL